MEEKGKRRGREKKEKGRERKTDIKYLQLKDTASLSLHENSKMFCEK